jgi:uncharacterized protein YndB with AHSA1/START domain
MKQATTETFELRIDRKIRAKRARVFEAFTNADDLARWSAPEGLEVTDGSVDLRVGGKWSVVMEDAARTMRHQAEGEYREISPPEKLVYTHYWVTDEQPVPTLITVDFHDEGDGTRVVMLHEGFVSEASRNGHEQGWTSCFDRLERMFA